MERAGKVAFCPKCGSQSEGDKFCRLCGTDLGAISKALSRDLPARPRSKSRGRTTLALFSEATVSNDVGRLDGHSAAAVFGEVTVDLTGRPLPPGETRINVYSVFAEAHVLVPADVAVRVTGVSLLASVKVRGQTVREGFMKMEEYRSPGYDTAVTRLHIDASAMFGEIKIRR